MVQAEDADKILSTGPSFAYGGRYNSLGEFGALYLSEAPHVCEHEKLKQVGDQPNLLPPQVLGSIEVSIPDVLDLTNEEKLKALGVTVQDITDLLDVTLPQAIAAAARSHGIKALLVLSAVAFSKNLVVFEEGLLHPDCRVKVVKTQKWHVMAP